MELIEGQFLALFSTATFFFVSNLKILFIM